MRRLHRSSWLVFLLVLFAGFTWAVTTRQVWEDFYITYRVSRNLTDGHGLTFTPGEKVHAFTSPLGVLLPAAAYELTGRSSDAAALWLFRGLSLSALGGAVVLLWRLLRGLYRSVAPAVLLAALLLTDHKSLSFAANGMETGFVLLFFSWSLALACLRPVRWPWWLGLAWGGMMWSRPDGCVSIAALATGMLLFAPGEGSWWRSRMSLGRSLGLAGLIGASVYLPWLAWAAWYYGSPIPHTIVAKGLFTDVSPVHLLHGLLLFPLTVLQGKSTLYATFMPTYGAWTNWPDLLPSLAFAIALVPLGVIFLPLVRWEARLAAWVYGVGHCYLTLVCGPWPWYLPPVAWAGLVTLVLVFGQGLEGLDAMQCRHEPVRAVRIVRLFLWSLAGAGVLGAATLTVVMARQAWLAMNLVEIPVRVATGRWLHQAAQSPHDTVFLEPLGFIGYYSGLKMYDFPGLGSPAMVVARRQAVLRDPPACWAELIRILRPDWLVLRPTEREAIRARDRSLLAQTYSLAHCFSAKDIIEKTAWVPLPGQLMHDAVFEIYRLNSSSAKR